LIRHSKKIVDDVTSRKRPDVAIVGRYGDIRLIKAASPSQTVGPMLNKIGQMGNTIIANNPGLSVSG
jgi:hypothetical protein